MAQFDKVNDAILAYDGECPFCNTYVRVVRVREHVALRMVDARDGGEFIEEVVQAGFNLDQGMVLRMGDSYYYGDECIHALALLSTSSGVFNRLNTVLFRHRNAARLFYPILRFFRNLTLKCLGRQPLDLRV